MTYIELEDGQIGSATRRARKRKSSDAPVVDVRSLLSALVDRSRRTWRKSRSSGGLLARGGS